MGNLLYLQDQSHI